MSDSPIVWMLDDLMKAAMSGGLDADTEDEFAEQTFQGVTVCARRVHQNNDHVLAFYDSVHATSESPSLTQVLDSIDKLEESIKKQARVWYHSFTEDDVREWKTMYRKLPTGASTKTPSRGEDSYSYTDDNSFDPYGMM